MFATFLTVALFVALAIQGAIAEFTISTPTLTQVFIFCRRELLWFTEILDLFFLFSAKTLRFLGKQPRVPTTSSS